ncbi:MAG: dTMP kinase [Patescibacteria group bacterium]|nr:dTMP kinase [Patescibacteria group bacterium]
MNSLRPKFIAIEGGEGSGKTTLMAALKEEFDDEAFYTREPGGSPYAELIREAAIKNPLAKTAPAETTLCLMFAARFDNVVNAVKSALERGLLVIADRFDGSSYAYNVAAQSDYALEDIFWKLRERLTIVPDAYIFLDVAPEEGLRRVNARNQSLIKGQYDHFDDRELGFHRKVREGYLKFLQKVPHIVIDGNKPLEEVKNAFLEAVHKSVDIK